MARVRTGDRPASTPPATNSVARVPTTPPSNLREVSSTKPPPGARTSTPQNIPPRAVAEASPTPSDLAVPGPSSGKATEQVEEPGVAAAWAYREAQVALSGDDLEVAIERLTKATLLNPRDFGYSAALAWAQLLVTPNDQRAKSAGKVRNLLNHAIQKSVESASLRLYLGWLERMLDHPQEALQQFSSIREGESGYAEAQQAIEEIRQEGAASKKPGLAVLFRKKP